MSAGAVGGRELWHGPARRPWRTARRGAGIGAKRNPAQGRVSVGRGPARRLLLAHPGLGAAEQREAHEAADFEFLAAVGRGDLDRIDLAGGRVEDLAAGPAAAVLADAPQDHHALDRLVLALA